MKFNQYLVLLVVLTFLLVLTSSFVVASPSDMNITEKEQMFKQKCGNGWKIEWDNETGAPHRILGSSCEITSQINLRSVSQNLRSSESKRLEEQTIEGNLEEIGNIFGVESKNLVLKNSDISGDKKRIEYQQYYEGVPVEFSSIGFTLDENGEMLMAGFDYYKDISLDTNPKISETEAVKKAQRRANLDDELLDEDYYINKTVFLKLNRLDGTFQSEIPIKEPEGDGEFFAAEKPNIEDEKGLEENSSSIDEVIEKEITVPFKVKREAPDIDSQLVILPRDGENQIDNKLAWKITLFSKEPLVREIIFIDANSGDILREDNLIKDDFRLYGNTYGYVYPTKKSDSPKLKYLNRLDGYAYIYDSDFMNADDYIGYTYLTDSYYDTSWVSDDCSNDYDWGSCADPYGVVSEELVGEYVKVISQDGDYSVGSSGYCSDLSSSCNANIIFDIGAKSNCYYHTNLVHDFYKNSPIYYNGMDYQMICYVDSGNGVNGMADGSNIHFGSWGGVDWVSEADVIYHEYTHDVIYHVYGNHFIGWGCGNSEGSAMDEGLADYFGVTITGDPKQGAYPYERDVSVNWNYITDYDHSSSADCHENGKIISSTLWDIRNTIGISKTNSLVFEALRNVPHPDTFEELLENILVEDDNNGNLNDGTPNGKDICRTFANHGMDFAICEQILDCSPIITSYPQNALVSDNVNIVWNNKCSVSQTRIRYCSPGFSCSYSNYEFSTPSQSGGTGTYHDTISPDEVGWWSFFIQSVSDSNNFYSDIKYINVENEPVIELTNQFSDNVIDEDGDGLYDNLIINAGVNVIEDGFYRVELSLYDTNSNYISWGHNYTNLSVGQQEVPILIDGTLIRKSGLDGPYVVYSVRIYDDQYNFLDSLYPEFNTAAYSYLEFQKPSVELGDEYTSYGEDEDGNGLYEYLVVSSSITVNKEGEYKIYALLTNESDQWWCPSQTGLNDQIGLALRHGEIINESIKKEVNQDAVGSGYCKYANLDLNLTKGDSTISIKFDGRELRGNEVTGDLYLKYIDVYDSDFNFVDTKTDSYSISSYDYNFFEKPLPPEVSIWRPWEDSWYNNETMDVYLTTDSLASSIEVFLDKEISLRSFCNDCNELSFQLTNLEEGEHKLNIFTSGYSDNSGNKSINFNIDTNYPEISVQFSNDAFDGESHLVSPNSPNTISYTVDESNLNSGVLAIADVISLGSENEIVEGIKFVQYLSNDTAGSISWDASQYKISNGVVVSEIIPIYQIEEGIYEVEGRICPNQEELVSSFVDNKENSFERINIFDFSRTSLENNEGCSWVSARFDKSTLEFINFSSDVDIDGDSIFYYYPADGDYSNMYVLDGINLVREDVEDNKEFDVYIAAYDMAYNTDYTINNLISDTTPPALINTDPLNGTQVNKLETLIINLTDLHGVSEENTEITATLNGLPFIDFNISYLVEEIINPPTISFSCSPNTVVQGETITCNCTATDDIDPNPTVDYVVNPSTLDIGTFMTSCTATNEAGKSSTLSLSYTVLSLDEEGPFPSGGGGGGGGGGSIKQTSTAIIEIQNPRNGDYVFSINVKDILNNLGKYEITIEDLNVFEDVDTNMQNFSFESNDIVNETTKEINFKENNNSIISFNWDYNISDLDFSKISVNKQDETAIEGSIIISGIDLTSQNQTKTVLIDKISSSANRLCIKDMGVASISEISVNCDGENEISLTCPGSSGSYACEIIDDTYYKVSGLSHTGIKEYTYTVPPSPPPSGGGGGGGGGSGGGGGGSSSTTSIPKTDGTATTSSDENIDTPDEGIVEEEPPQENNTQEETRTLLQRILDFFRGGAPTGAAITGAAIGEDGESGKGNLGFVITFGVIIVGIVGVLIWHNKKKKTGKLKTPK
ncbi:MAG: hypothetical protein KJ600_04015 [Nanoarchaeota archaeon]|nr:hypothetical protein [Nanoarchaeota archaeon]